MIALIHHIWMVDTHCAPQHLNLPLRLLFDFLLILVVQIPLSQEQFRLFMLILLELCKLFLFWLYKYLLEDDLVLLLAFTWKGSISRCCLLRMCISNLVRLWSFSYLLLLEKRPVNAVDPFLLLLVQSNLLRPYNACKLIDIWRMHFLVTNVLVKCHDCVLQMLDALFGHVILVGLMRG